jgi:hypothetical protein
MREFAVWVPGDCTAAETPHRKRRALAVMADSFDARTSGAARR